MLATLNIVIGLIFVLLLFSLLASTVMEVIAAILSLRAKNLRYALESMLQEKAGEFVQHPLFQQLSYATSRKARISPYFLPSYLSKNTFTSILGDIMDVNDRQKLKEKIDKLDEGGLKRMMQFMFRQSSNTGKTFLTELDRWFDEVMDRSSGWYRRSLKWWLFAVGLVLAGLFNVDTIQVYQSISTSAAVQNFLVEMASDFERTTSEVNGPNLNLSVEESIDRLNAAVQRIEPLKSPLGLGWSDQDTGGSLPWWLTKVAGLLITAIAVTFGAPFWYDLLKKLLSLRGSSGSKTAAVSPAGSGQTVVNVAAPAPPPSISHSTADKPASDDTEPVG